MLPPAQRRRASCSLAAMPAPAAVTASMSSRRTSCFVCFQDWHFVSPRPFVSDHLRRHLRCRSDVPGFIGATASLPCKAARSVPEPVSRGNSHCRGIGASSREAATGASYRSSTPPAMALATKLTSLDASCALHAGLRSQGGENRSALLAGFLTWQYFGERNGKHHDDAQGAAHHSQVDSAATRAASWHTRGLVVERDHAVLRPTAASVASTSTRTPRVSSSHHAAYRTCGSMASFDDRKLARRAKRLGLMPAAYVPR
jgi:hypothetical protein